MKKIKILKICCSVWKNESRDKRELTLCREIGMEPVVMAKGNSGDKFKEDTVDGFDVLRFTTKPLGTKVPNVLNRVLSLFCWARYAHKIDSDIISAHDLPALFIGWLSMLFTKKKNRAALIYDSHEFEIGRNAKRNQVQKWFIKKLEKFLMKRSCFTIVVNDVISEEMKKIHKLKKPPIVVRSTPSLWEIDKETVRQMHDDLCQSLQVPRETFLVMYHGVLAKDRGIETLFEAVKCNQHICGVVLGDGETSYVTQLTAMTVEMGINDRILFVPSVKMENLWKYVGAADVGLILIVPTVKSYEYSLPNKFFENIQSETPIICTKLKTLSGIVNQYHIGFCCDALDVQEINRYIEKMRTDVDFYNTCKQNLLVAKQDLCWEKEKEILKRSYLSILEKK